uniref:PHD finger protein ALFIN-LIKE n=1 Tax=Chenopodium quinoa TaxID=63459 RepID=A0A803KR47_CHEQI
MDIGAQYNPRTVEEVFRDFKGRRAGLIKALTTDVEDFYQQCDPEKENLCLYGFPSEQWEVNLPAEEVPPELPEPALGINFARDGMQEKDWLALVAVHSDAWLLSVAFYFGARFGFDKAERKRLFHMVNELPTIFEVVTGSAKKQVKERSSTPNHSNNKPKSNSNSKSFAAPFYFFIQLHELKQGLWVLSCQPHKMMVTRELDREYMKPTLLPDMGYQVNLRSCPLVMYALIGYNLCMSLELLLGSRIFGSGPENFLSL